MNAILLLLVLGSDLNMAGSPREFVMCDDVPRTAFVMCDTVQPVAVQQPRQGYPVRGSWWSHPGANTRAELIQHLTTGVHRGKFDRKWLESLTMPQLESLHSDDHENRVRINVPKPATVMRPASNAPN